MSKMIKTLMKMNISLEIYSTHCVYDNKKRIKNLSCSLINGTRELEGVTCGMILVLNVDFSMQTFELIW